MLTKEARAVLQRYTAGNVSNGELARWLVEQEYNTEIARDERDALASLRLVLTEEGEGRRPSEDILEAVAELLARREAPSSTRRPSRVAAPAKPRRTF